MNSFTAEIGSQGYHVYGETTWQNLALHQKVKVLKNSNSIRGVARTFLKEGIKCLKMSATLIGRQVKFLGFGPT